VNNIVSKILGVGVLQPRLFVSDFSFIVFKRVLSFTAFLTNSKVSGWISLTVYAGRMIELCSARLIEGVSSHNAFAFYLD